MITLDEMPHVLEDYTKIALQQICKNECLSEDVIVEYANKMDWSAVSKCQYLSEEMIRKCSHLLDWYNICRKQNLSEKLIKEFADNMIWVYICTYQKLSEEFIEEYKDKFDWNKIGVYQQLSEPFIIKHFDELGKYNISTYQKLSDEFIKQHDIKTSKTNWIYWTKQHKLAHIKRYNNDFGKRKSHFDIESDINKGYEIVDDSYIVAYKSVRKDNYSHFSFRYKYEVGKEYEAHCDCNFNHDNSFGLSAWTKNDILTYYNNKGKLLKVHIDIDDIGTITEQGKIRAKKFKVISEKIL